MKPKASGYLSLKEAADILGLEGHDRIRRLRRRLEGRERATGKTILTRFPGEERTICRVTLASLRHHCPELFSKRDEMAEQVAERMTELEGRITELAARQDATVKALQSLRKHVMSVMDNAA